MGKGTVVFDLDGTLANTSADLLAAANRALADNGYAANLVPGPDDRIAGRGAKAMLRTGLERLGLDDGPVDDLYPQVLAAYDAAIDTHSHLYPGTLAMLDALSGRPLAVCTNKPEGLARKLLTSLDVLNRFGALVGSDTYPVRKPDPLPLRKAITQAGGDPTHALMVGDTVTDRNTATAAGLPCALVTFGPEGAEAMRALAPEALVDHFDALPGVVAHLLGD